MNANTIAKNYGNLTPEERFRLILAASGRGDEAERDRLAKSGGRIGFTVSDHWPYAAAFLEVGLHTFMELQEDAALYAEAFACLEAARDLYGEEDAEGTEAEEGEEPTTQPFLDVVLAAGFMLRMKADGWKLFCERLTVPPFQLWERCPGSDRLRRALALAEKAAFVPEGMLRFLKEVDQRQGKPERSELPWTVEGVAAALEIMFRAHVGWWGG
jgi:hypothetical protein